MDDTAILPIWVLLYSFKSLRLNFDGKIVKNSWNWLEFVKSAHLTRLLEGKKSTASFRGIKKLFETLNICEVKTAFIHFVWKWTRRVRVKKIHYKVTYTIFECYFHFPNNFAYLNIIGKWIFFTHLQFTLQNEQWIQWKKVLSTMASPFPSSSSSLS